MSPDGIPQPPNGPDLDKNGVPVKKPPKDRDRRLSAGLQTRVSAGR
jgi:hypothetical protein